MDLQQAARDLRILFDAARYLALYPDIRETGIDPVEHYLRFGADEGREPCALFDGSWYRSRYTDIAAAGLNPLLHYIRHGGMEMRDPNPRFNAAYYVDVHPEATGNPLLYHLLVGQAQGWPTEPPITRDALLPSQIPVRAVPVAVVPVDVIIPVYRGLAQTRRCIESVLADPVRPPGRVVVIDDRSPEPELSAWLDQLAKQGAITLLRNRRNLGFVRSVNLGIVTTGGAGATSPAPDVVLLNSDTEVPPGWLARLARAASARDDIATVSPFSNNATICSYPRAGGGALPAGLDLATIDTACRAANAGRVVELPTTVGFCMYIRRAALDAVGPFDAEIFGHGYGEEVDFCLRAKALGWRHVLACDVFVYHEGEVSFGPASSHARKGEAALHARHPDYATLLLRHGRLDPAHPARFALTAALFRQNGLPGILFVSHGQGGGVRRQMLEMMAALRGQANLMLLQPDMRGVALSVPGIEGHPVLSLAAERVEDLALYLRSAAIQRVHIHHVMEISMDVRALIQCLGVPFDLTVHDYYGICPQVNLLPVLDAQYCGEPAARHCNACIAATPSNGATDIDSWRFAHAWMFRDAARVLCPSEDARARLARHGLGKNALVAPHEAVPARAWTLAPVRLTPPDAPLRVALLGVLADRKGLATVASVAGMAGPEIALHLLGHPEQELAAPLSTRLSVSGAYAEAALPGLIAQCQPHVFWFPAQWPETYSYTLSAAIEAGGAIIAADLGAFTERLRGRPLTWLVPADAPAEAWLVAFAAARQALGKTRTPRRAVMREPVEDYYTLEYLRPVLEPDPHKAAPAKSRPARARRAAPRVLIIPDAWKAACPARAPISGCCSPCIIRSSRRAVKCT